MVYQAMRLTSRPNMRLRAPPTSIIGTKAVQDMAVAPASTAGLPDSVRRDFPILDQQVHEKPLIYLDSAATSQKPAVVLDTVRDFYAHDNANVHRGVHALAARATDAYEAARTKVADLINASSDREIVWTRNASEAINLVAQTWARANLIEGDEVVVSVAEHHANIVPWQMVCKEKGAILKHVNLSAQQEIDVNHLNELVTDRTKLVALPHVSNVLGCTLAVDDVVDIARKRGAKVLLDACQSVPHMPVDVQALQVDWIVASAHKMCAPSGVGFLWGRYDLLEEMPPWQGGGEMIDQVHLDHSTYAPPPLRFEAGTPAIAEVVGLGAAVDYLTGTAGGMRAVHAYEEEIGGYLYERLAAVDGVTVYGPPPDVPRGRAALAAFNVDGLHATDVSMLLDAAGVAVRSGHHCAQPLHGMLGVNASARASAYLYNTRAEVDAFVEALKESAAFFKQLQ